MVHRLLVPSWIFVEDSGEFDFLGVRGSSDTEKIFGSTGVGSRVSYTLIGLDLQVEVAIAGQVPILCK